MLDIRTFIYKCKVNTRLEEHCKWYNITNCILIGGFAGMNCLNAEFFNDMIMLPNGKKVNMKIKERQILGIVSCNEKLKNDILNHLKKKLDDVESISTDLLESTKSAKENLEGIGMNCNENLIDRLLCLGGLVEKQDTLAAGLNKYEKTKLKILRQGLMYKRIIFLEEAFSDLSKNEWEELNDIIVEFSTWNAIVITGSSEEEFGNICDIIINLDKEMAE